MQIEAIFAALVTRDLTLTEPFYTTLLGRGPDDRPMDGLIQWRGVSGANIQIFEDDEHAGHSRCTIVVPDMDAVRSILAESGHTLGPDIQGTFGTIAQIRDPDGNLVTLTEPPAA